MRDNNSVRAGPVARLWASANGGFNRSDAPPAPERSGRGHRLLIAAIVIGVSSSLIAVLALPGTALMGRIVGIVADRLSIGGPGGKITLPAIAQRSVMVASGGELIATLTGEKNRRVVPLAQVAPIARQAVLAIEDARFYQHEGIDGAGLARAVFANAKAGRVREGGSTITQQLVKNVIVGSERTIDRKLREAQYAIALERTLTKSQILELYLNETYFGDGVYGIEAAAEYYFGVKASGLRTEQAALLAGLIAAPERYNPLDDPKRALARRSTVLRRMADEGFITQTDMTRLDAKPLDVSKHVLPPAVEPYFVDFIKQQLLDDPRLGRTVADREKALFQGGLRIETTLDLRLQEGARNAVDTVLNLPKDPAAALVSIDPTTGTVRAMVGGKNFNSEQFNLAIGKNRQPGSVFKAMVLVAALNEGVSAGLTLNTPSPLNTTDQIGRPYAPRNYSDRGEGLMNMRKATELSINSYYVQLIKLIGEDKVVEAARKLGITSKIEPITSLALGTPGVSPYEMASAYATLANNGIYCKPFTIRRVVGADHKEIFRNDPVCSRAFDSTVASQATNILEGVITRGTGKRNGQIGRPAGGKTGTTDDYTDAWFIGFTRQYSTAVWLGFPESTKRSLYNIHGLPKVFGGSLPAEIWNKYMRVAHQGLPVIAFPAPPVRPTVAVPNVVGLTRDEAISVLKAAGFTIKTIIVSSTFASGIVVGQSPRGGAKVDSGSLVALSVSNGTGNTPPPSSSPSPTPTPTPTPSPTSS